MRFTTPLALLLLLLLPVFALLAMPSLTGWREQRAGGGRWFRLNWQQVSSRELLSLLLRLAIALALILALAGLELVRHSDQLAVVFLLDASDSMPPSAQAAAGHYIQQSMQAMRPDDQAAVVVFGGDALVERNMSPVRQLAPVSSAPNPNQTNLAAAIRLGLALYPPGAARRMVILSDGVATTGDAQAAARLAAASGVQIVSVPFLIQPGAETLITSVEVPSHLHQGERFDLRLGVQTTQATRAKVRILSSGQLVYQGEHDLKPGAQSFSLPLTAGDPGFSRFEVQIEPDQDTYYQNNEMQAFSQVGGPPRLLVVTPQPGEPLPAFGQSGPAARPDEAAPLLQALRLTNFDVQLIRPEALPSDLVELAPYAGVVLVDVPASQLSSRQMRAIQSYVRDLGGGLVAVGGPTSYGVGGYFRTPLEETLPVNMQIKDQLRRPTLTMVFIIDHSGSMSETSGGAMKLELAKEAAIRSVELLAPTDRVGVIAFDDSASWIVPIQDLGDPAKVQNAIATIRAGGGTDILAGLQAMASALPGDPASVKHVILLTDGGASPAGIPELVTKLYQQDGITLSTVGVGQDAAPFLSNLAELGGGRYHFTADPASIPSIFTEETTLATRAYLNEHTFTPQQASSSPILSGIQALPPLHGYVGTSSKSVARTILVSDQGDPILAAWQYGLGKAVAFTSDASGRWARDWVQWSGFASFWSQAINAALSEPNSTGLDVRVEQNNASPGASANLLVDARDENGDFLNDYRMEARLVAPDGKVQTLSLQQVAPGRYQAGFTPGQPGAYLIGISGQPPQGGAPVGDTAGWVLSYSPEYRNLDSRPQTLAQLAALTGGEIAGQDPGTVFAHNLPSGRATRPVWFWLLGAAALLLPVDIALRRLVITQAELRRAWIRLSQRTGRILSRRSEPAQQASSQRMQSLLHAKRRIGEASPEKGASQPPASPPQTPHPPVSPSVQPKPARPAGEETEDRKSLQTEKEAGTTETKERSTAASLLESKRQRRRNG